MSTARKYDLYTAEFKAQSHATFALMREHDPVFCQVGMDGKTPIWFVTRYDLVDQILRDDKRFVRELHHALTSDQLAEVPTLSEAEELLFNHMLNKDWADHARLRRLVSKSFTPATVARMRPRVQAIADGLLDALPARGEMDLIENFAFPLPIIVICELLGVPDEDRDRFRAWSDAIVMPALTPEQHAEFLVNAQAFVAYLRRMFEQRRAQPRDDMVSGLLQAEEAGDKLSEAELFSMLMLLIVAGHETTVTLITNSVLALMRHPDAMARLKADPTLMPAAVEEFLRYDSPVERTFNRWAAEDVELGGQRIPRGAAIISVVAAANRDAAHFAGPDSLDIARAQNDHISFGKGAHYCLGAPLARLEGEIALNTLLRRLPNLRLAVPDGELVYRTVPLFHALTRLPVAWG